MKTAMDELTIIAVSLILLMIVASIALKMNLVTAAGVGTLSALFGGAISYGVCYFVNPASAILCGVAGSIASMWSSTLTLYFAMMQAAAQGVHIGFVISG
ncbi:hypothetical protein IPA_01015 [Ignicoccus pacificus DSM 13166]|uniref:Uncharacterized protein n=1 Tax=Ignicoccus pacificus DSM 13166 TaxID=940294 RepID=A0A977KAF3_9CREN|nr:hypothetical protein IPA_01015 [Ignicoccus pacificus DSM 13166]